jgi:hypothetical protein
MENNERDLSNCVTRATKRCRLIFFQIFCPAIAFSPITTTFAIKFSRPLIWSLNPKLPPTKNTPNYQDSTPTFPFPDERNFFPSCLNSKRRTVARMSGRPSVFTSQVRFNSFFFFWQEESLLVVPSSSVQSRSPHHGIQQGDCRDVDPQSSSSSSILRISQRG